MGQRDRPEDPVADGGLAIDSAVATGIVGAYGGTVYLCAILGGWVADHLTGSERAMFLSGILIMAGHISLALIPAVWGLGIGLGLIAIGSGGLKANITNLVGSLYTREDMVERAWELVTPVLDAWSTTGAEPNYAAGTWGPAAASRLLERHGHVWNGT